MSAMKKIAIWVLVAILIVGAGEVALRLIIPKQIAEAMRSQFHLDTAHPVEVSTKGIALVSAVQGRIPDTRIHVPELPVGEGIVPDVVLHAHSAPFDPSKGEIEQGSMQLTFPADEMGTILGLMAGDAWQSATIENGEILVGSSFDVGGMQIPISAAIAITPGDANELQISPELRENPDSPVSLDELLAMGGAELAQPSTVCMRDSLPQGFTITGVEVTADGGLLVTVDLAPTILSDPAEMRAGTCD